jgi:ADP-heptose:LPS heptosyltransferase
VGYKKELRSVLLTNAFVKKNNLHRVEEYTNLLQQFLNRLVSAPSVELNNNNTTAKKNAVIVNINSEANSRRLPKQKAISIINALRKNIEEEIILVGSNKEATFVSEVFNALDETNNISNLAGKTSLTELLTVLGSCSVMLTTDSGPAHVANALGVYTIVLFGAGNENNTAPYNIANRTILRLGQLPCEPCVSNECKVYGTPECLLRLNENTIIQLVINELKKV